MTIFFCTHKIYIPIYNYIYTPSRSLYLLACMGKNEINVLKTIGDIIDGSHDLLWYIRTLNNAVHKYVYYCVLGMISEEPKTVVGSVKVWTPTDKLVEDSKLVYYMVMFHRLT